MIRLFAARAEDATHDCWPLKLEYNENRATIRRVKLQPIPLILARLSRFSVIYDPSHHIIASHVPTIEAEKDCISSDQLRMNTPKFCGTH